jgi:hypothetical protein
MTGARRIYEIYQGQELKAIVCVREDGQKEWDFSPDPVEQGFWMKDTPVQEDIERMIDHSPNEDFHFGRFTIRRRKEGTA